ncbi:serine hydrolase domain-containing protein [Arsenicicoccus dermatophilus]|uniref:serine hydrolase domain-containing protein n=1 Tax=Arsenicicoccus dermatophilus TaxID=1076331 RepID=UPI0039172033
MPTLTAEIVSDLVPYLRSWVERQRQVRREPGLQVAVRVRGELVWSEAFGVADVTTGEPLTTRHLFRIASHSKWFTATALMRLREQGRVRLDDEVGQLLPAYAETPLADVTVRELLAHLGGTIRDGVDTDWWQLGKDFPDAEQLRELVARHGRTFEVNEHFKYSNIGYGILGRVVEQVTGRSYADALRALVIEPLGLADTAAELDEPRLGDYAAGHSRPLDETGRRVTIDHVRTGALAAATGFSSTAEDVTAFASAHVLGDDRLLTDRSKRAMQRPAAATGKVGHYGLGEIIARVGERTLVGHSGGYPGHITRTYVDPQDGLAVSVLGNSLGSGSTPVAQGVVALIDLALRDRASWQRETDRERLESFVGRYEALWGTADVVRLRDRLVLLDPDAPDPVESHDELDVVDADTLAVEPEDSYGGSGEPITVERDETGAVRVLRVTGVSHWTEQEYARRTAEHVRLAR